MDSDGCRDTTASGYADERETTEDRDESRCQGVYGRGLHGAPPSCKGNPSADCDHRSAAWVKRPFALLELHHKNQATEERP